MLAGGDLSIYPIVHVTVICRLLHESQQSLRRCSSLLIESTLEVSLSKSALNGCYRPSGAAAGWAAWP